MVTDPIADFLTRIRNAQMAGHRIVEIPASNLKKRMTEILYNQGYILKYKFEEDGKQGLIKIALKYDPTSKVPAITSLERISRPGLRRDGADVRVENRAGAHLQFTPFSLILLSPSLRPFGKPFSSEFAEFPCISAANFASACPCSAETFAGSRFSEPTPFLKAMKFGDFATATPAPA